MIIGFITEKNLTVTSYLSEIKQKMSGLNIFTSRFSIDYKYWVDEEDELFIVMNIKIHLLSLPLLLILGLGTMYLSTIFHLSFLVWVGMLFVLGSIVHMPPFWAFVFKKGLVKKGYAGKVRLVSFGRITERLYDGAVGNI